MSKDYKTSERFRAVRAHHTTELAEDYCELINALELKRGVARTSDIAFELGVSHVTVIHALRRLLKDGYVNLKPRGPVSLTPKGKRLARSSAQRHELLLGFFEFLGVPKRIAEIDVEGAEHHISAVTLKAIKSFMSKRRAP